MLRFFRIRALRSELLQLSQEARKISFPPVTFGSYEYKEEVVGNHLCHYRRPVGASASAAWELVLDPAKEQEAGSDMIGIGPFSVSHDGTRLAFLKSVGSDDVWHVAAREISSGRIIPLPEWIKRRVAKAVEWDASGRFLFVSLTQEGDMLRPCVCVVIDTETGKTDEVAEESDPQFMLELSATKDRKYIRIGKLSYDCTEQV